MTTMTGTGMLGTALAGMLLAFTPAISGAVAPPPAAKVALNLEAACQPEALQAAAARRSPKLTVKPIRNGPALTGGTRLTAAAKRLPAYCQVSGSFVTNPKTGKTANFLATFPANWNGKYLQMGCSGHCGQFAVSNAAADLVTITNQGHPGQIIEKGYASIATDEGHEGFDGGIWAVKGPGQVDEDAIEDFYEVEIDNSIYLAIQTYHRHQVPSPDYHAWDQFRGADGKPIYPQRPILVGPFIPQRAAGSVQNGRFTGKMIVVESLMDQYAYPWCADWYRSKVKEALGPKLDDRFRLWFTDHAMHGPPDAGPMRTRVVSYNNVLQQALRDVSAWVEQGVPPPANTRYRMVDSQVLVPAKAAERKGIQPVVTLAANGGIRAEVGVGQPVSFTGTIEVPPDTGKVVRAEWDFEGAGDYPVTGQIKLADAAGTRATVTTTYAFARPGTYFPALRAASQRLPDPTPYAQIENLARVRVVVT